MRHSGLMQPMVRLIEQSTLARGVPVEEIGRMVVAETLNRIRRRTSQKQDRFAALLGKQLGRHVHPTEVGRWESPGPTGRLPGSDIFLAYLAVAGISPETLVK